MSTGDELCTCGHKREAHIYHEGACRPGWICESECTGFRIARRSLRGEWEAAGKPEYGPHAGKPPYELLVRVERDEVIARAFHETYELLAASFNYTTRAESAVPWEEVPQENRRLMRAVVMTLLHEGVIR